MKANTVLEFKTRTSSKQDLQDKLSPWKFLKTKGNLHFELPIYFNEPVSLLQKNAEIMANYQILVTANNTNNSLHRLAQVAMFSVAQFSGSIGRKYKPLNALLGETFEILNNDYRYFSEQVSSDVSACCAESNDYSLRFQTQLNSEAIENEWTFNPIGVIHVKLKKWEEEYKIERPNVVVRTKTDNNLYIDCIGKSTIINKKTKEMCVLEYYEKGLSESTYGVIEGFIANDEGNKLIEITGKWTEYIQMRNIKTNKVEVLWKCPSIVKDTKNHYGLPIFVQEMNKLTKELEAVLPPTDSRLRPDRKALEDNDIKLASNEKYRLEEIQRANSVVRKNKKIAYKPIYFKEYIDPVSDEKEYKFNGKYWEDRKKMDWSHLPNIY